MRFLNYLLIFFTFQCIAQIKSEILKEGDCVIEISKITLNSSEDKRFEEIRENFLRESDSLQILSIITDSGYSLKRKQKLYFMNNESFVYRNLIEDTVIESNINFKTVVEKLEKIKGKNILIACPGRSSRNRIVEIYVMEKCEIIFGFYLTGEKLNNLTIDRLENEIDFMRLFD